MDTSSPTISRETAAHVLSHFGRGGYPAGDWTESLISVIVRADRTNGAKLSLAFPDYGAAIDLAKNHEAGIAILQAIARGETPTIRCTRCRNEDGPFTDAGLCEPCARPMPLDGVA